MNILEEDAKCATKIAQKSIIMRRSEQLKIVQSLFEDGMRSIRCDCFACGGKHTLSISREHGWLKWHCFKASCKVRGVEAVALTSREIEQKLHKADNTKLATFKLPDYLVPATANRECVNYLARNNCLNAYTQRLVDVRYDPKQHRAVFIIKEDGQPIDAVGRALDTQDKPKWLRYGASGKPLIVGTHSHAVLVEDAASACAVSPYVAGVALMGTNVMDTHLSHLRNYDRVVVALDADATRKALDIQRLLNYYVDSSILRMDDEFKDLADNQIRERLNIT